MKLNLNNYFILKPMMEDFFCYKDLYELKEVDFIKLKIVLIKFKMSSDKD